MSSKKIGKLQSEVAKWEAKTAELEQQGRQAGAREAELEDQRSRQILAALAEDDLIAKKELEKLTLELDRTGRHSADLVLAKQQADKRVDALRQELAAAERADNEEQLLQLLKRREDIGHEMARLLEEDLLPLLHQASGFNDEMGKLAHRLGLECAIRAPVFTSFIEFPQWRVLQEFPLSYSLLRPAEPVEGRSFRPPDLSADPSLALAAHSQQFRRRLLEDVERKRQAAAASVVAAT